MRLVQTTTVGSGSSIVVVTLTHQPPFLDVGIQLEGQTMHNFEHLILHALDSCSKVLLPVLHVYSVTIKYNKLNFDSQNT
jgi:hypothetical protein